MRPDPERTDIDYRAPLTVRLGIPRNEADYRRLVDEDLPRNLKMVRDDPHAMGAWRAVRNMWVRKRLYELGQRGGVALPSKVDPSLVPTRRELGVAADPGHYSAKQLESWVAAGAKLPAAIAAQAQVVLAQPATPGAVDATTSMPKPAAGASFGAREAAMLGLTVLAGYAAWRFLHAR